jgi:tripeptide aminopeptidase
LQMMNEDVDELVAKFSIGEVKILTEPIGNRPAGEISADHPFIKLSQKVLEEIGIHPNLTIGSTDVNIPLSLGIPALCVGVTSGGNAHTIEEYINTELILKGIIQLILLVEDLFKF